ncbi:hypothetical protein BIV24_14035 [Streptomyces colonosanans]|uniref:Uncharacterized protein n=1 Tax=Streptomyces colonosanans TaxID=1428652 RepID=A0A1S2PFZ9_9ACTN|nr:hypothetical protein BIV24_14035 [Streptomyces colonosanans]
MGVVSPEEEARRGAGDTMCPEAREGAADGDTDEAVTGAVEDVAVSVGRMTYFGRPAGCGTRTPYPG